ncbi:MAG: DUF2934 domain-containing protein [Acetobacteraceae bacterium]|jgi:Protein of unknown function (DUF2934)
MKPAPEMLEGRIRECAYHIWEASGRPSGRDDEIWQRACEEIATGDDAPSSKANGHQRKVARSTQPPRRRSRKAS